MRSERDRRPPEVELDPLNERLEERAHERPVALQSFGAQTGERRREAAIRHVDLRAPDEPLAPVRRPGRHLVNEKAHPENRQIALEVETGTPGALLSSDPSAAAREGTG